MPTSDKQAGSSIRFLPYPMHARNPIYLSTFLIDIGIGIACASWLYLLLIAIFIVLKDYLIAPEERWCLEKYGDAYREYMDRTPKWIGIPKSEKKD